MPLSASDLLHNADVFRRAYPNWPSAEPEESAMSTETTPDHCPRCFSPDPALHPAVQCEGEVRNAAHGPGDHGTGMKE